MIGVTTSVRSTGGTSDEVPFCMAWAAESRDSPDSCDRMPSDTGWRSRITDAQRVAAEAAYTKVDAILVRLGRCFTDQGRPCPLEHPARRPTRADADRFTQDATGAGFTRTTARVADNDDPAPTGSLLYAVQVDDNTCAIGYMLHIPQGAGGHDFVGVLPHGGCLDG